MVSTKLVYTGKKSKMNKADVRIPDVGYRKVKVGDVIDVPIVAVPVMLGSGNFVFETDFNKKDSDPIATETADKVEKESKETKETKKEKKKTKKEGGKK